MQLAALSASSDRAVQYFDMASARRPELTATENDARRSFLRKVGAVIGARQKPAEMQKVLHAAVDAQPSSNWWRAASLEGLADGVLRRKPDPASLKSVQDVLFRLFENPATPIRRAALNLLQASNVGEGAGYQRALQRSLTAAADRSIDSEQRADAISFLALVRPSDHLELLKRLVDVQEPAPSPDGCNACAGQDSG